MCKVIILTLVLLLFSCEKFCNQAETVSKNVASKLEKNWKCNGNHVYKDFSAWFNKYLCKKYPLPEERLIGASLVCNIVLYELGKMTAAHIAEIWECDKSLVEKDLTLPSKLCPLLDLI